MGGAPWGEETTLSTVCMAQTQPLMVHYLPRTGQLPTTALGKGMGAESREVTKQAQQWAGLGHKNSYQTPRWQRRVTYSPIQAGATEKSLCKAEQVDKHEVGTRGQGARPAVLVLEEDSHSIACLDSFPGICGLGASQIVPLIPPPNSLVMLPET